MAKKLIQEYNSFGEWGQDRGGDVLGALANIFGDVGKIAQFKKGMGQEDIMKKALARYGSEIGATELVDPEMEETKMAKAYDYRTQEPIGRENIPTGEYGIKKTSEQRFGEMTPEQQMELIALKREQENKTAKGGAGGFGYDDKIRYAFQLYQTLSQIPKDALSKDPNRDKALQWAIQQLQGAGVYPGQGFSPSSSLEDLLK